MKSQDIVNIAVTFVVGTIVGAYLYIFGFSQQFSVFETLDRFQSGMTVTGGAYGGCEVRGLCGTFTVASDGTYQVYPTVSDRALRSLTEGTVNDVLWQQWQKTFTVAALEEFSYPIVPGTCESEQGGVDYDIRVMRQGTEYELDTCDTAVVRNPEALGLLRQLISDVGL